MLAADITFGQGQLAGALVMPSQNLTALLIPSGFENGAFEWTLAAERLVLNWTNSTRIEVADPANPSDEYASMEKGPPEYGEEVFSDAALASRSRSSDSNVLLRASNGETPKAHVRMEGILRLPPSVSSMQAGSNAASTASYPADNTTTIRYNPPVGHVEVRVWGGLLVVQGDFSFAVWDASLEVESHGRRVTREAGTTARNVYPSPTGPSMVRERDYRLITVHATQAILELDASAMDAVLEFPRMVVGGHANATFSDAKGMLQLGTATSVMTPDRLAVTANLSMETWRSHDAEARLSAHLSAQGLEVLEDGTGASLLAAPPGPNGGTGLVSQLSWLWFIGIALVALMGGFGVYRRLGPVKIEDVEWALLNGRARSGHRLARRLFRRRPSDPDVLFLYGSTLLARGLTANILCEIEPLARKIPSTHRRGIAYVLAVAAKAQGNHLLARRWAGEAGKEPLLRAQLDGHALGRGQGGRKRPTASLPYQSGYS